jgi:hypothetical protein
MMLALSFLRLRNSPGELAWFLNRSGMRPICRESIYTWVALHDTYSAHQGVEHDNMNVLCLGARVIGPELMLDLVRAFMAARFSGEERHRRRLAKIAALERRFSGEERTTLSR